MRIYMCVCACVCVCVRIFSVWPARAVVLVGQPRDTERALARPSIEERLSLERSLLLNAPNLSSLVPKARARLSHSARLLKKKHAGASQSPIFFKGEGKKVDKQKASFSSLRRKGDFSEKKKNLIG